MKWKTDVKFPLNKAHCQHSEGFNVYYLRICISLTPELAHDLLSISLFPFCSPVGYCCFANQNVTPACTSISQTYCIITVTMGAMCDTFNPNEQGFPLFPTSISRSSYLASNLVVETKS